METSPSDITDLLRQAAAGDSTALARVRWESRGHFLAIAATAMRRVLIDHARTKSRMKRDWDFARLWLLEALAEPKTDSDVKLA
ncbi:MAG: ECF-type sigma factor [Phycisphaerae bacterium]|nr:ECF-type sigma factor [Phycisphaerae bacterium]